LLVDVSSPSPTVVHRATSLPQAGAWVLAVWRTSDALSFTPANFGQSSAGVCGSVSVQELHTSVPLTNAMIGAGLFNMDGDLLGLILPCGDHIAVVHTSSIEEILKRFDTLEQRLLSRYGAAFSALAEDERRYVGDANGVIVRELWTDSPADAAGLWPGDVVTAINSQPVSAIDDLRPLAVTADSAFDLRVRRGRRAVALTLESATPPVAPASDRGVVVEASPDTFRIDAVRSDSRAARAGIRAGDRLLRINGARPRSVEQARRALSSRATAPLLLEIVRDRRRIAVVLP
jgi:S1-C subfamily serine protease